VPSVRCISADNSVQICISLKIAFMSYLFHSLFNSAFPGVLNDKDCGW
jgi:hypothetical protein